MERARSRGGAAARGHAEADHRRDQQVRARRRVRTRARLRPALRVAEVAARPAGDQPRPRPRLGRHAAPGARRLRPRRRQGARPSPAAKSRPRRRCGSASSTRSRILSSTTRSKSRKLAAKSPVALRVAESTCSTSRPARSTGEKPRNSATCSRVRTRRGPLRLRREARPEVHRQVTSAQEESRRSARSSGPHAPADPLARRRCGRRDGCRPRPHSRFEPPIHQTAGLQVALRAQGLYRGPIDAISGPATVAAVRAFQQREGLPVTGLADARTREAFGPLGRPLFGARTLRRGEFGWDVAVLQFELVRQGINVPVNAYFDGPTLRRKCASCSSGST